MVASRYVIEASPSSLLHWARRRESAGDLIGSGVCLRAALYRQLFAMATAHRCLPKSRDDRNSPGRLASALHRAGVLSDSDHRWVREAIAAGNAAAHVGKVDRPTLRGGLFAVGMIIDEWPNGQKTPRLAEGGAL